MTDEIEIKDRAARDASWKAFAQDPVWQKALTFVTRPKVQESSAQ